MEATVLDPSTPNGHVEIVTLYIDDPEDVEKSNQLECLLPSIENGETKRVAIENISLSNSETRPITMKIEYNLEENTNQMHISIERIIVEYAKNKSIPFEYVEEKTIPVRHVFKQDEISPCVEDGDTVDISIKQEVGVSNEDMVDATLNVIDKHEHNGFIAATMNIPEHIDAVITSNESLIANEGKTRCCVVSNKHEYTEESIVIMQPDNTDVPWIRECQICSEIFTKEADFNSHMHIHVSENRERNRERKVYKCKDCEKVFTKMSALVRHNRQHSGERPFKCTQCYKSFKQKVHLVQHCQAHDHNRKLFKCDTCQKTFTKEYSLKRHSIKHLDLKLNTWQFKCGVCDKTYSTSKELQQHSKIHKGKKLHQCEICDKLLGNKQMYLLHVRSHLGKKPWMCDICGESYILEHLLRTHKSRYHPSSNDKTHQCNVCDRNFSTTAVLNRHIRIHTGEKPYVCHICGQAFTQNGVFKRHLLVHSGRKDWKCNVCEKSYAIMADLKRHIQLSHLGDIPNAVIFTGKDVSDKSNNAKQDNTDFVDDES